MGTDGMDRPLLTREGEPGADAEENDDDRSVSETVRTACSASRSSRSSRAAPLGL